MITHEQFMTELLSDSTVKAEYDALEEEFTLLAEMLEARKSAGLSQKDVAKKMKSKQSAIARIEAAGGSKRHSPTLSTLRKYADAVGCNLDIHLVPRHTA
jgi:transcriptional regulator with XRE-family HTH domain